MRQKKKKREKEAVKKDQTVAQKEVIRCGLKRRGLNKESSAETVCDEL